MLFKHTITTKYIYKTITIDKEIVSIECVIQVERKRYCWNVPATMELK